MAINKNEMRELARAMIEYSEAMNSPKLTKLSRKYGSPKIAINFDVPKEVLNPTDYWVINRYRANRINRLLRTFPNKWLETESGVLFPCDLSMRRVYDCVAKLNSEDLIEVNNFPHDETLGGIERLIKHYVVPSENPKYVLNLFKRTVHKL